jgi:hypothetical protein
MFHDCLVCFLLLNTMNDQIHSHIDNVAARKAALTDIQCYIEGFQTD